MLSDSHNGPTEEEIVLLIDYEDWINILLTVYKYIIIYLFIYVFLHELCCPMMCVCVGYAYDRRMAWSATIENGS